MNNLQEINKINISNISNNTLDLQIDTTGRINEKLISKFSKTDIIKSTDTPVPQSSDDTVYSSLKVDSLISQNIFNYSLNSISNNNTLNEDLEEIKFVKENSYYSLKKLENSEYINFNVPIGTQITIKNSKQIFFLYDYTNDNPQKQIWIDKNKVQNLTLYNSSSNVSYNKYIDNVNIEFGLKLKNIVNDNNEYFNFNLNKIAIIEEYSENNKSYINLNIYDFKLSLSDMCLYQGTNHCILYTDSSDIDNTTITIKDESIQVIVSKNIHNYIKNNTDTNEVVYGSLFILRVNINNKPYKYNTYKPINIITPFYDNNTIDYYKNLPVSLVISSFEKQSTEIISNSMNFKVNGEDNNIIFYYKNSSSEEVLTSYFNFENVIFEEDTN